jgi:hypothetical protein
MRAITMRAITMRAIAMRAIAMRAKLDLRVLRVARLGWRFGGSAVPVMPVMPVMAVMPGVLRSGVIRALMWCRRGVPIVRSHGLSGGTGLGGYTPRGKSLDTPRGYVNP